MITNTIEGWFARRGWTPFAFQRETWDAYQAGRSGLIHAATGTGKTYAAWLGPLSEWLAENPTFDADPATAPPLRVLWITPLRALAADSEDALRAPLNDLGLPWTLESRTGDTSAAVRNRQRKRLPSALITTPESLSLLLTRPDAVRLFADLRAVIVDEWHELAASKRGVQTELALARLRQWRPTLRIWGISATLGNLNTALASLLGNDISDGQLIRGLAPKAIRVESIIPETMERFPWAGHLGTKLLPQVIARVEAGNSALVFTNTRAQAEIWYQALIDARPDWIGSVALHHSALERKTRDWVEQGLRDGLLRCVVCTSSLDLGVDFTPVDSVIQVGSPKGVARLLQRAGRSGHQPGAESRILCVPTHAFELIEVAAARDAIAAGKVEARVPYDRPLDVLAQHAVTIALGGGFMSEELLSEVRTTYAYRDLLDAEWEWVLDFITRGGPALHNYPEYARVNIQEGRYVVTDSQIARRHRMSIGTIVSDTSLRVQYLKGGTLGHVEESFVSRLHAGDKFVFAGKILQFVRLRELTVWVRKVTGKTGIVPRWGGSRMAFSSELSAAVRIRLEQARGGLFEGAEMEAVRPILMLQAKWSHIPALDELLIERVKTREGHHLFFYPFEGRSVHEGLAALFAYRLARLQPITFTLAVNDYGFELLSPEPAPLDIALSGDDSLFSTHHLLDDITASLNASEMAKRQFREIARISGLIFQGYPGHPKTAKQVQVSSGLLYDVFARYDPANLLVEQASREVLERQLERSRLALALERFTNGRVTQTQPPGVTPFAFPLWVERVRESVTSETLADRVQKMQLRLEKVADKK